MSEAAELRAALRANDRFYAALTEGDMAAMEELWSATASVICTHPGSTTLHGRSAVMESWAQILQSPPDIRHSDAQVTLIRGLAFVSCVEHLGGGLLAATNVFVWEDGDWRMVDHQAGGVAPAGSRETLH